VRILFRTIRQRRHRARAAQVSAVATILGLLLVVTFISQFVIAPLPIRMASIEYEHVVQVEDQLARLQATVLAQASNPGVGLALSSPITLGSGSLPPWAGPSSGAVQSESASIRTVGGYALSQVVPAPPTWGFGSNCLFNGSGKCASNGNIDTWNVTGQDNSSFGITINGNSNSVRYNITGNNDSIYINWTGGDTGFVQFIINGSDDHIIYNKGGSDTSRPVAQFLFFGQRDVFDFNPSGSHAAPGSMNLTVVFIGSLNEICPYGNLSSTDRLGTLTAGGSNLNMSVIWWNAVGYATAPHTVPYPGSPSGTEFITFQNSTGILGCAFTKSYPTAYTNHFGAGLVVHLYNHYQPPTDIAYDQGAIIENAEGGRAVMVVPPALTYTVVPQGFSVTLTLVNLVGTTLTDAGTETAAITTQILGVQTVLLANSGGSFQLTSPLFFNVSTLYPAAWAGFFTGHPQLFPGGASCRSSVVISAPYSCLQPPPGVVVVESAALSAQSVRLTTVTVAVAVV